MIAEARHVPVVVKVEEVEDTEFHRLQERLRAVEERLETAIQRLLDDGVPFDMRVQLVLRLLTGG